MSAANEQRAVVIRSDEARAEELWGSLRDALTNTERVLIEIISAKAWLPLGYESFAAAWASEMQGFYLATQAIKAHVVYALYDSGMSDAGALAAAGVGSGLGPSTLKEIRGQYLAGVPAEVAGTRVRAHVRGERRRRFVTVELDPREVAEYETLCSFSNSSLRAEAEKALRIHFERLAREVRPRG